MASTCTGTKTKLTQEEVTQINLLIPRLCSANHLKEAINLISTALSTTNPPPLKSVPLPLLLHKLSLEPDLTNSMYFLNTLKYSQNPPFPQKYFLLLSIAMMFLSYSFQTSQPKKALKIFHWVSKPDFPGGLVRDSEFYAVLVHGFCNNDMVLEALRVLRVMVSENLVVGDDVRMFIYKGLLRDARIGDAVELNETLCCICASGTGDGETVKKLVDILDPLIANWVQ
ncbi:pentatricopeptide repeat-containing protein [Forsythia ovata]|uniref:Pentatricopeptide repeat-containing protein n=1 Tax=Forsythia ovata TaxID=205694 RepID=A0ABD1RZV3_9LAMI